MRRKRRAPRALEFAAKAARTDTERVTERNLEVMAGVRDGYSHAEIALQLCLSIKTVEYHVGRVMEITRTSSQSEAVAVLVKKGLL